MRDPALVEFAAAPGTTVARASVIVEAKRPPVPPSPPPRANSTAATDWLPPPSRRRTPAVRTTLAGPMRELQAVLKRLGLADQARRNNLSGSFVVEVTPQQLRELAATPAVQAIRCNRQHRRRLA
ncbi:hypothetical protein AAW51_0830 [Caldimonas brevitalea]|uniref:Uncharacterized protein n=1 Tax=Caldimonas brevitalea TaxID=413882 RepID=A0A0G3BJG8_9BURK|nr:hypothetical protein AAW51_0830 [Caldimonas brevitalea]